MSETIDPVAALAAPQLGVRAAGARELALHGGVEHLGRLLELAVVDPSRGVRLGCAAAAADILSRHRRPPARDRLDAAARSALFASFSRHDPQVNPGLFQVAALLEVPEAVRRVFLGLRDPRLDVRVGAVVGLGRMVVGTRYNGDPAMEAEVVATLGDGRIRLETRADIARICADAGYTSARAAVDTLHEQAGRGTKEALAETLRRLDTPPPVDGFWVDLGVDAGEAVADPVVRARAASVGDTWVVAGPEGVVVRPRGAPRRCVSWKRLGTPAPAHCMQEGARSWWEAEAEDLVDLGDALVGAAAWEAVALIDPILPGTAAGLRLRGAAALAQGDVDAALLALAAAVELKKVPPDTWWFYAEALLRADRPAEARPQLERFLSKAGKKAPFVAEARARLG